MFQKHVWCFTILYQHIAVLIYHNCRSSAGIHEGVQPKSLQQFGRNRLSLAREPVVRRGRADDFK